MFENHGGTILLLGQPGSGKTEKLLELGRELADRARFNGNPIPVVVNLSSWRRGDELAVWIERELVEKYNVPARRTREWLNNNELVLLLDGLDEVGPDAVGPCIVAINRFREHHGFTKLCVSCRAEDYEAAGLKLDLDGAFILNPLTDDQIDGYMALSSTAAVAMRELLERDSDLRIWHRNPLMLNIMAVVIGRRGGLDLSGTRSGRCVVRGLRGRDAHSKARCPGTRRE